MHRHFPAAPWTTTLKLVSALATAALLASAFAAYRVAPAQLGFTHYFGIGVAFLPIAVVFGCLFFMVGGYAMEGDDLYVERLVTSTRISLAGLTRAWHEPSVCKGSIRVLGNGGLFAFTGLFYKKGLGRYRLFATDFSRAVVLMLPQGAVVVTPADPDAFVEHLRHCFPNIDGAP